MRQYACAPASARKQPEIFCCTLYMRRSCSAWLLSKGVCSGEVWVEWAAGDDGFEGGQQRYALLAKGGKIPAEAGERICAPVRAEAAGHLLLHLEHANVALGLVVVKGDGEVVGERQHLLLAEPQAFEQVARWRLLDPSTLARAAFRRRIGGMPGGEQLAIAGDERPATGGGEGAQPSGAGHTLHLDALTLVTRLHLLALCRLAVSFAHWRCPPPLPAGPGGPPPRYAQESPPL